MKFKLSTKLRKSRFSPRQRATASSNKTRKSLTLPDLDLRDENSALSSKIRFLWARSHSFYQKIPVNSVMREICEYVGEVQKSIAVLEDEVRWFSGNTGCLKQLISLRDPVSVSLYSSSVCISQNRVFVCGGGSWPCTFHTDNHVYVLKPDGTVQELPNMLDGRCMHGVAWDSVTGVIYAFGGCVPYVGRQCEQFRASQWLRLPDMHFERFHFNPCWYSSVVFLCGGWHNTSVETYDPDSDTMNLLDLELPMDTHSTTVVASDTLIVISNFYISKLKKEKFSSRLHNAHYWPTSSCVPMVQGNLVSIVALLDNYYREIDLATGDLVKEISL